MIRALHTEAEQALVVACCMDPRSIALANEVKPSSFMSPKWKAAWSALIEMHGTGEPIDAITVADYVTSMGGKIEPFELVDRIGDFDPSRVEQYAKVVKDARLLRDTALACSQTLENIKSGMDATQTLSEAQRLIGDVCEDESDGTSGAWDLVKARYAGIVETLDGRRGPSGIPTGIASLDQRLGGIQPGIVTVVAGRPGMGKSAFAMSIVDGASRRGFGCHVFSMEDTREAYADRIIARVSGVAVEKLRNPQQLNRGDLEAIGRTTKSIKERNGWIIDDRAGLDVNEIIRCVRKHKRENGTRLVIIDYINLIKIPQFTKRHEAIDEVMRSFAQAAKQDGMSYVVLAQLNRGCESRDNKRPLLSDLKESGGIEEKAKCVLFLYRPSVYNDKDEHGRTVPESIVEVIIRKNNQGSTGVAVAEFEPTTITIS